MGYELTEEETIELDENGLTVRLAVEWTIEYET